MLLNGLLLFQGNRIDSYEKYEEEIEALFQRVMQSDRIDIREQAQAYLISKLMEKQDYEQAQKVLDTISKRGCSTENSFRQICTLRRES